jgi:hypothetical protein
LYLPYPNPHKCKQCTIVHMEKNTRNPRDFGQTSCGVQLGIRVMACVRVLVCALQCMAKSTS